jgi:hypothetical protein
MVDSSELIQRLTDHEDRFTERKTEGAGSSEFKKAMVAFANSLPPNRNGGTVHRCGGLWGDSWRREP